MALTSQKYERTGVFAVDMVAAAVEFHEKRLLSLKTIYLKPRLFNEFKAWAEEKAGAQAEEFTFAHVDVKRASRLSFKDIYFDFYPQNPTNVN